MKIALRKSAVALSLLLPCLAHSQLISEYVFTQNGGDMNNIAGTIAAANESLRQKSYSPEFNAVGHIYGCTATWLGDDDEWVYILSAAHCNASKTDVGNTNYSFYADDNKTVIGKGPGTVHTVPQRNNRPAGYGGASTDLEILKLKKVADFLDPNGNKVVKPVLYDGNAEKGLPVEFVGYGYWGVRTTENSSYGPLTGQRRLTSMSVIDEIFEQEHGLGAGYEPVKNSLKWGRTASGDSGSAWWQTHHGIKTIISVTQGHGNGSNGPRISQYIDWIKSVYPDVDILSEHAFDWGYNDRQGTIGDLYVYDNPYNHQTEYFMLSGLGSDDRYWYFPTDKSNNAYWFYLGTDKTQALQRIDNVKGYKTWGNDGRKGNAGDIYVYYNPYNHSTELFRLKKTGEYWYFPTNKKDNTDWQYVLTIKY